MKTFWIIRHGMTALNSERGAEDRLRGWKDVPLNKAGRAEAERLAQKFKNSDIDVIYHSPLSRAADTAKAIQKATGAKLVAMEELKPWNVGDYTGERTVDVLPILARFCCDTPEKSLPNGESFNTFMDRVFRGLRKASNGGYKHPALVSHYRVERTLKAYIAAGQPANHRIDKKTFLQKGEPTGHAEKIDLKV
jgi:uncharacterized phosphatase